MYNFNKYEAEVFDFIIRTKLGIINREFKTEFDCMNFLFSVYGTGYVWENGEIVYRFTEFQILSGENKIKEAMIGVLSNLSLEEYKKLKLKFKFDSDISTLFSDLYYVYPITKGYSLMTLIPDEIEQSWFDALTKFHRMLNNNISKLSDKDIKGLRYSEKLLSKTKIKSC